VGISSVRTGGSATRSFDDSYSLNIRENFKAHAMA
jgi:hypothetical protein